MSDELPVGDKTYVSSKRASEISGYAQDYIGQLARSGQIEATRTGGLWYVWMESLESYKNKSDEAKTVLPKDLKPQEKESEILVSFDGKDYISANRAAKITGYNQDYVGQLARSGKILSRQVGNRWYVDRVGILAHKQEKDALLANVQAAAVGIPRATPGESSYKALQEAPIEMEPLMTYNVERADLTPKIGAGMGELSDYGDTLRKAGEQDEYEIPEPTPVRITVRKPLISASQRPMPRTRPQESQGTKRSAGRLPFAVGLSILTIVIVLSVGFLGFTASSKFAASDNSTLGMTASAVQGSALSVFGSLMDNFENIVAPPLVYQAKD